MEGLKEDQRKKLETFQERIRDLTEQMHDEDKTDHELVRWLVARAWDVDKAEDMFRNNFQWRKDFDLEKFFENYKPNEILKRYWPGGLHSRRTKDGRLIQVEWFGNCDFAGMVRATSKEEMIKFAVYNAEKTERILKEEARKEGGPIRKTVIIQNLANASARQMSSAAHAIFKELLKVISDNYPERMGTAYFINIPAPKLFALGWNIMKNFFDENLKSKFVFLGNDWKDKLLEVVDEKDLPAFMGGQLREPDDFCTAYLSVGGVVPESLFRGNDESYEKINVPARSSVEIEVIVNWKHSTFTYEFVTEGHDIKFGLRYLGTQEEVQELREKKKNLKKEGEVILEPERFSEVSKEMVSGKMVLAQVGVYLMEFDNSYSLLRSKNIKYKFNVEVENPPESLVN